MNNGTIYAILKRSETQPDCNDERKTRIVETSHFYVSHIGDARCIHKTRPVCPAVVKRLPVGFVAADAAASSWRCTGAAILQSSIGHTHYRMTVTQTATLALDQD